MESEPEESEQEEPELTQEDFETYFKYISQVQVPTEPLDTDFDIDSPREPDFFEVDEKVIKPKKKKKPKRKKVK